MRLVWGCENIVIPFVSKLARCPAGFGECRTAAVLNSQGDFVAGLVFHNWTPEYGVIEVSAAATDSKWAQRNILSEALEYVFRHNQLAVARCSENNKRVRRLWRALGADEVVIPRLRGRDEAEAILTLSDEAWSASRLSR